jgi:hypothetical protein
MIKVYNYQGRKYDKKLTRRPKEAIIEQHWSLDWDWDTKINWETVTEDSEKRQ